MGKPTASCFKMIACGGDSVDHDDLHTTESKSSSDRRGWSFRKRSARHRVLSNSVTTEAPPSVNKETSESTVVNFHVQPDLPVPEKTSVVQLTEEKIELSAQPDIKLSGKVTSTTEEVCGADATPDEPSIVVIQTTPDEPSIVVIQAAIRTLLAQKVLLKQKNIIKLQAVVRGHLVRRYAIGTLRCVQSIIRMQALVRARRNRLLADGSGDSAKQSERSGNNCNDSTVLTKKIGKINGLYTYVSIDKLLSNAFARQLMESTPRTKPINIKCDPSKSDSAWKWLERWMSVSSVTGEESLESDSDVELGKEHVGHSNGKENIVDPSECYSEPTDFTSGAAASVEISKKDDKEISDVRNNLDTHLLKSISASSSHSDLHSNDGSDSRYEITESPSVEMEEVNLDEKVETKWVPKEEINEQDGPDSKKLSPEQAETEAKRFTRKPSNPAFIAAQSKFEELSSAAPSAKVLKSSIHNPGVDSGEDKVSSSTDQPIRSRDFGLPDNAVSNISPVQIGGSECGTELSISSTLDSPERSVTGGNEIEQETKVSEDIVTDRRRGENLEHGLNGTTVILETTPSLTEREDLERYECINTAAGESMSSMIAADSPQVVEKEAEAAEPLEPQLEVQTETSHPVNKLSPEASPRSHITASESQATPSTEVNQATPSSEVSAKTKKNKGEKGDSNSKNKSSSADKKSRLNRNQDSALRSNLEQLQENKTGKRRNSLGSGKPDQKEMEKEKEKKEKEREKEHAPRDSSSSNSLPSYMQATESARAKAISNGSPRSSPDVHDKDIYIKKRHSLPGSNERQGSPRIQRSLSQAQQNAKGSVTQSPQERMWRR